VKKIGVFIIDDSAVVRQTLAEILSEDPEIEITGYAADPIFAMEKIKKNRPDVLTLDVEMPRMDGIAFLRQMMVSPDPIPAVICSSLTDKGTDVALRALEAGAVGVIAKPRLDVKGFLEESKTMLIDAVKGAARARLRKIPPLKAQPKLTADAVISRGSTGDIIETTDKVIAMGASTGGTEALREILEAVPPGLPGIVIVQHMPEHFTAAFAKRLDGICRIEVREAANGDRVRPGLALIAPGNKHMTLKRNGAQYFVEISEGSLVSRHRPSVDVLFRSVARYAGPNAAGVILTGMGDDGAAGMLEMKQAGSGTLAQDEASCVVFGMPKEAIKRGAVEKVIPLSVVASSLVSRFGTNHR
jgi:two-component system chemotaxis response regulator CheB